MAARPVPGPVAGVVEAWDDAEGVGVVRTEAGAVLDLQCTDLADGTRTTATGTRVTGVAAPGHHGRWRAEEVRPAS